MRRALLEVLLAAVLALLPALAAAEAYEFGPLTLDHLFARATPPAAKTGAIYFIVDNAGKQTDRLLRASTPVAGGVVLHQMAVEEGMMKMRAIPSVEIRPGARVEFKPDGYHLMLIDLRQSLRAGETFPVMLTFERAGTVRVSVLVEEMGAMPARQK
jgi:periplasmic copper chaperone A